MSYPLTIMLMLEGEAGAAPWWNYPGLELWKFINLFVFIGAILYLHHIFGRPVREGLKQRGERIKKDLLAAAEAREKALSELAAAEKKLSLLSDEAAILREQSQAELRAELERLKSSVENEIEALKMRAKREIESASSAAEFELRKFVALQSVTLAEQLVRKEITPEDDVKLIGSNVQQFGGSPN